MHIQLHGALAQAQITQLCDDLCNMLRNVGLATRDWLKMRERLRVASKELGALPESHGDGHTDEYAAFLAVGIFERVQKKKYEDIEKACATVLANYYSVWATNGADPGVIDAIDKLADKYPLLNDAIATNTVSTTNAAAK